MMSVVLTCVNCVQDCLGVHRECSHRDHEVVGRCVCQEGYEQVSVDSIACDKKGQQILNNSSFFLNKLFNLFSAVQKVRGLHVSCNTDDDCKRSEVRRLPDIIFVTPKFANGQYLGLHVVEV